MAAKRFHVSKPRELRALEEFLRTGSLRAMVTVWSAVARKHEKTSWDDAIYVGFSGDRARVAEVIRINPDGRIVYCATLRYNLALRWCEQNLRQIYI